MPACGSPPPLRSRRRWRPSRAATGAEQVRRSATTRNGRRGSGATAGDVSQRWARREDLALLTDYYQLTMMGGYWRRAAATCAPASTTSSATCRPIPASPSRPGWSNCSTSSRTCVSRARTSTYLAVLGVFTTEFLEYLESFRPTLYHPRRARRDRGVPTRAGAAVEGPLTEAQFLETVVLNTLNSRRSSPPRRRASVWPAAATTVVEFGLRRAKGPDGGLSGSRAAYIGGADCTSNVLAGKLFGIPVAGHARPLLGDELRRRAGRFPRLRGAAIRDPLLLVDTYDTLKSGLPNAVALFKELRAAAAGRARRGAAGLRRPCPAEQGGLSHVHRGRVPRSAHRGVERTGRRPHRRPQAPEGPASTPGAWGPT